MCFIKIENENFKISMILSTLIPYSARTDFSQNLTSVDGQILTTKVGPGAVRVKIFIMAVDP